MERISESCTDVQAALPLYVGSDLEPTEQAAVAAHLDGCVDCSRLAQSAQRARDVLWTLRDREELAPAPQLWGGIRARLVSEGLLKLAPDGDEAGRELSRPAPAGPRTGAPWGGYRRTAQVGGLAAAAALALFIGLHDRLPGGSVQDGSQDGSQDSSQDSSQGSSQGITAPALVRDDHAPVRSDPAPDGAVRLVAHSLRHVGAAGTPLLLEAREFPAAVPPVGVGRGSLNALTGSPSPAWLTRPNSGRDPRVR